MPSRIWLGAGIGLACAAGAVAIWTAWGRTRRAGVGDRPTGCSNAVVTEPTPETNSGGPAPAATASQTCSHEPAAVAVKPNEPHGEGNDVVDDDGTVHATTEQDEFVLGYGHTKLAVKPSVIPGAGQGLFTTQCIEAGDIVAVYTGKVLRTVPALRVKDKAYLMRLGPQVYVDARERLDVLARYINDCRNKLKYNVRFDKQPEQKRALVVALRRIEAGEELYVNYGRFYWVKTKGNRLS